MTNESYALCVRMCVCVSLHVLVCVLGSSAACLGDASDRALTLSRRIVPRDRTHQLEGVGGGDTLQS